jgi:hypothetical protein
MRLCGIFLASDSFVFASGVMQREPGMADGHNRGRSSEREFGFRCQGLAFVEVCLALFERDHNQSSSLRCSQPTQHPLHLDRRPSALPPRGRNAGII